MPKQSNDLHREGEPSQETEKGLKIPVPKRADFDEFFDGVKKDSSKKKEPPKKGQR